jgi:hypothetical protein
MVETMSQFQEEESVRRNALLVHRKRGGLRLFPNGANFRHVDTDIAYVCVSDIILLPINEIKNDISMTDTE